MKLVDNAGGEARGQRRAKLDHDVGAGDDKPMYVEGFGCLLDRGWRLIASQLPHQGKTMSVLARS